MLSDLENRALLQMDSSRASSREGLEASELAQAARAATQKRGVAIVAPPLENFQEAEYRRVFAALGSEGANGLIVGNNAEHATN